MAYDMACISPITEHKTKERKEKEMSTCFTANVSMTLKKALKGNEANGWQLTPMQMGTLAMETGLSVAQMTKWNTHVRLHWGQHMQRFLRSADDDEPDMYAHRMRLQFFTPDPSKAAFVVMNGGMLEGDFCVCAYSHVETFVDVYVRFNTSLCTMHVYDRLAAVGMYELKVVDFAPEDKDDTATLAHMEQLVQGHGYCLTRRGEAQCTRTETVAELKARLQAAETLVERLQTTVAVCQWQVAEALVDGLDEAHAHQSGLAAKYRRIVVEGDAEPTKKRQRPSVDDMVV
jgi:hypothetical protein